MNFGEICIALSSGALGAGVMKLLDTWFASRLSKKAKKQDSAQINMVQISCDVQDHKQRIEELEADKERKDNIEQAQLKAMVALLDHAITGNATGDMKKARDNLVDAIIVNK